MRAAPSECRPSRSEPRSRSMRWWRSVRTDRSRRPDWLTARPYAHRGRHGPSAPENSRAAFRAAIAAGEGIELDVRLSRCGTPFVFHDPSLDRLCEANGPLDARDRAELGAVKLKGNGETIPSLDEILSLVAGAVPLLIELKPERRSRSRLCAAVAAALAAYAGPAAVMSFDPRVAAWFARHASAVVRGLVVSEQGKRNLKALRARTLALILGRPDFLAYDIRSLPSPFAARARSRALPVLSWTVR